MPVSELQCRKIRDWCNNGAVLVKYVAKYYDVSERTIRKHKNGECGHSHEIPDEIHRYERLDAEGKFSG